MIVLDTTVLVYAVGAGHALAEPCRELVRGIGAGEIRATTTVEVLQEFTHVRARRRGRQDAVELTRRFATLLSPLLQVESADLDRGLELFASEERLGAFDAVLAATVRRVGAAALVSADRGFAALRSPTHLDPSAPDFLDRARSLR